MQINPAEDATADEGSGGAAKAGGVIAVDRALSILDVFISADGALSLSEIAKKTGLVKPTVLRSLSSLERAGYILRIQDRRYQLGAKAIQLGASYTRNFRLESVVLPVLRRLTVDTEESASFFIREDGKRVCLFRVESSQTVRDVIDVNVARFLDGTSGSLALMHDSLPDELPGRAIYFTSGVNDAQAASIATPIYGMDRLVGSLSLSGPVQRFQAEQVEAFARLLAVNADDLSAKLGGRPRPADGIRLIVSSRGATAGGARRRPRES